MKIATFNVNGVNGRLPVLLRWLAEDYMVWAQLSRDRRASIPRHLLS